jgi:NodT family efflux transporter outer membrane factor (OMF) lipoprotein
MTHHNLTRLVGAIGLSLAYTACAVGPNFHQPVLAPTAAYTTQPVSQTSGDTTSGGVAQRFDYGGDLPAEWWTLFHSPALNDLVERALKVNPDLKAAQAALTAARENMLAKRGAYFPSVDAGFNASKNKTSGELSPATSSGALYYSLYTPQVNVSFVPDVFGLNRRTVESAAAQEDAARFQLIATDITLSSNVVAAAIQEASLRAQVAATRQLVAVNTNEVQILRAQFARGYAARLDVAAQESQLAQVAATLPPLLRQLAQQRDLLSALAGSFPNQMLPDTFTLAALQLPEQLPVSLPSRLVEQRPDIRQAEANLHAASAQVGVAIANRLPNITLSANAGASSVSASNIFSPAASFWSLIGGLTQPIFAGGTLLHQQRAAQAAYEQATAQYQSTVITAFQNVADVLNALVEDADGLQAADAAAKAAKVTLDVAQDQVRVGYASTLALLNAEQTYQQALITLAQAQSNRFADTAALFQALGGGWWRGAYAPGGA